MKLQALLVIVFVFIVSACGENQTSAPTDAGETTGVIKLPLPVPESDKKAAVRQAVMNHMHQHARQLGRLMEALNSGDIEATQTPAYWLSRHEGVGVFPKKWEPHISDMRKAANDLQWSTDLQTARAAAGRIAESCHACHADAGFEVDITRLDFD